MHFSRIYLILVVMAGVVLPGCVFHKHNYLKNMPRIGGERSQIQIKDKVVVRTKAFDARDAKNYFDTDLVSRGYTPVQICIENNSNEMYVFRPSYVNLEIVSTDAVAQELYSNTALKTSAMFTAGYLGLVFFHPLWPLMIAAPYYGWASHKKNQKITDRLPLNTIQEWQGDMRIPPHTTLNKFVFTPSAGFQRTFTVGVFNEDAKRYDQFHFNENERFFALEHRLS